MSADTEDVAVLLIAVAMHDGGCSDRRCGHSIIDSLYGERARALAAQLRKAGYLAPLGAALERQLGHKLAAGAVTKHLGPPCETPPNVTRLTYIGEWEDYGP
jgi:hypothetical protein